MPSNDRLPLIDRAVTRSHTAPRSSTSPLIESASRLRTFAPFTLTVPLMLDTRSSFWLATPLALASPDTVFTSVAPGAAAASTSPLTASALTSPLMFAIRMSPEIECA